MKQLVSDQSLIRFVHARLSPGFVGREDEFLACRQLARDTMNGHVRSLVVTGPRGSGKSELVKRSVLDLHHLNFDILPIFIDLGFNEASFQNDGAVSTDKASFVLINRMILRQVLSAASRMELMDPFWLDSDMASISGLCHGAGLGNMAVYLKQPSELCSCTGIWVSMFHQL